MLKYKNAMTLFKRNVSIQLDPSHDLEIPIK